MPTIDEFKNLNPALYFPDNNIGGNMNLLISCSLRTGSDSDDPTFNDGPFHLQGLTIPFFSSTGENVYNPLAEVDIIKFEYAGQVHTAEILDRQKRTTHYYLRFKDIVINYTASVNDQDGNPFEPSSDLVFTPFSKANFANSDWNPRIGNSDALKTHASAQVVDRDSSQLVPSNLTAIIAGTAQAASIQNCSYTKAGLVNARYAGSKLNSGSVVGDDPALGLRSFNASLHPLDSDDTTVKNIQLSDRDVISVKFNSKRIATGSSFEFQNFPSGSNIIFIEENNRVIRLANSKIYSTDKNQVYTADENGIVTSVV